jgi:hypothetical protein
MGIVYRAYDLNRQRSVALKTMQWVEPATLYRFKQEFRALAGLSHPNLVTLYELVSDGRLWFFTMELVEGVPFLTYIRAQHQPLQSYTPTVYDTLKPGELPEPSAASMQPGPLGLTAPQVERLRAALRQLAAGIHALHEGGKLHRDIKPANALVTEQGRVVLLDFGLAAELDRTGLHLSTEPELLGTVAYMAPEQATAQPVSPATDWYAVGVILYEALTSQLPFNPATTPPFEVLQNKQRFDPPPPHSLVREVPEDLDRLTVELLRRNPQDRPSGREVIQRLSDERGARSEDRGAKTEEGGARSAPRHGVSLIGRKRHLELLAAAFETTRQGQTVVVHVHGPSGVGKSALVRYFLDGLVEREEAVVLAGQCYEQEAVPYKALDSLVDTLSRYLIRLSAVDLGSVLPRDVLALARVFPVLRRVAAVEQAPRRPLNLSDPQEVRRRALTALRELLGRLGDRRPLVLFIDDLQWGDADSAALLIDVLQPPDAPTLLLVLGYRSEDADTSPCLKILLRPVAQTGAGQPPLVERRDLPVEPLTAEEGRDLVLALLDVSHPKANRAEALARESGGNPFFLHELVHYVQQDSLGPLAQRVPQGRDISLHDVLWARILRLSPDARQLLEVVAVAGRPLRQVDACQAAQLETAAAAAVAQLRSGRFIRSAGPAERNEIESYHDRIRETILARLTAEVLQDHHRRLAHVLKASGQADLELLAILFEGAGEPAQAEKYYARAAAQAAETLAFDRAAKLYRLAIQLHPRPEGPDADSEILSLRTQLGDALANAGRGAESAREYLAAAALKNTSPDLALELRRRAAFQFLISGHVDEGLATLRVVLAGVGMKLPQTPRRALWALVFRRLQLRWRGLDYRPRAAAEVAPADLTRINICWSASVGLSMVDPIQGAYFQTRGLLLALAAGEPYHLSRELAMEAGHVSIGGGPSRMRAERLFEAADALVNQVNHPYPHAIVTMARGVAAALEGSWRKAHDLCDQAVAIFRNSCTGVVWELDTSQRFALWALMYRGEVPEMARRLPLLLKEAHERDDLYAVTNLSQVVGTFVRLTADEPERARRDLELVMDRWSRQGFHVQHMDRLHSEAQIDLYLGDGQAAWDRLTDRWTTVASSHLFRVQQVRIYMRDLYARSALAAARGSPRPGAYLRVAERAARLLEKERVAWAAALAQLLRAGAATIRGTPEKTGLLRDAAASLAGVDMPLHAASARRLLGRVLGGNEGQTLVAEADDWMKGRTIQNPGRVGTMLAPGLGD